MNNRFSRREQRQEAAHRYRVECLNARGEVECSECGAGVNEARGNRNAQELEREGVRKSGKGPVCNACQASWRYSHHQDSEMEMANASSDQVRAMKAMLSNDEASTDAELIQHFVDKVGVTKAEALAWVSKRDQYLKGMEMANARTMRCSCGGYLEKVGDDRWECGDCNQLFEADDWAHGGPDNPDKLKAVQNASGCGICGEKGHVYNVDGDKKILCEKHAAEAGGVLLSNADNAKCQCGHTYDQHEEDSDGAKGAAGSMPCTKCGCHSYYPERGFKDHLKDLEK